jgi:hypothetical protein
MWQQEVWTELSAGMFKPHGQQENELKQLSDVGTCITDFTALGALSGSI